MVNQFQIVLLGLLYFMSWVVTVIINMSEVIITITVEKQSTMKMQLETFINYHREGMMIKCIRNQRKAMNKNIHMKISVLLLTMLISVTFFGQKKEKLFIEITRSGLATEVYNNFDVKISNYSDSILAVLHSHHIFLTIGNNPQQLALLDSSDSKYNYTLNYAVKDTLHVYEVLQFRAILILPYQSLSFRISVPISNNTSTLNLDYFYLGDISYKKFKREMLIGNWYKKYKRLKGQMLLPQ